MYLTQLLLAAFVVIVTPLMSGAAQVVAFMVAAALAGPVLIEVIALLINISIRPGQLLLGRRRRQLLAQHARKHAKDPEPHPLTVLILTSYVRDPAAAKGTAEKLIRSLQERWKDEKPVVIGYPANRPLMQVYRALGAVGDGRRGRRMMFDYRDPRVNSAKLRPPKD